MIIIGIVLVNGCISQPIEEKPEDVAKTWFESIIKEDWNTVFANMVDEDGSYYSEDCKQRFTKAFSIWAGATYSYETKEIKNCTESALYVNLAETLGLETPDECVVVYHSYWMRFPDGTEQSQEDNFWVLIKVENKWKIQALCEFLPP